MVVWVMLASVQLREREGERNIIVMDVAVQFVYSLLLNKCYTPVDLSKAVSSCY